jgi:hypothetical protein
VRHEANTRRTRIIKYSTGNALHNFHRRPFTPTKSYDFPAVLLFDGQIPMLFRSPVKLYHDSSIFDSTIAASVASMDLGISFLVVLHITLPAIIAYTFCFTGFIFPRHFSHRVSVLHRTLHSQVTVDKYFPHTLNTTEKFPPQVSCLSKFDITIGYTAPRPS